MNIVQISTPWYANATASLESITEIINDLLGSKVFADTPMEQFNEHHYGRPPAFVNMKDVNDELDTAFHASLVDVRDPQNLTILDGLVNWMYRNTDGIVRHCCLIISWYLKPKVETTVPEGRYAYHHNSAVDMTAVHKALSGESVMYLAHVIRHATVSVPMESRLPLQQCRQLYQELGALSSPENQLTEDAELVDESLKALNSVNPSMNLPVIIEGRGAREYAIRRLFQTVQAIGTFKSDSNYSTLRAAFSNFNTLAFLANSKSTELDKAARDVLTISAAVERSITGYACTANNILARARAGHLVYAEMSKLAKDWHALINGDLDLLFKLMANLIKTILNPREAVVKSSRPGANIDKDPLIIHTLDDMLTRTNIKSTYLMRRSRMVKR